MSNPNLPQLNDMTAMNYFQSIESDALAYQNLYSDLLNDFLGAIETRFNITNAQRDYIISFTNHQKQIIQCSIKTLADYLNEEPYLGKKVIPQIQGLSENPPQPVNDINIKAGAKIEKDFQTGSTKGTLFIEISC